MTRRIEVSLTELEPSALDQVVGGESLGLYLSFGYTSPLNTGGITLALGGQSSFPYVTGGLYKTTGEGFSTGGSFGFSVGGFRASENADSYFTGPGMHV